MKTLNIDQEFKDLIPPISYEEEELLIESIKKEGCHTPLVVWGDILVDGHNRYEICTENGIEFTTRSMEFADRDDAKVWIINNQFGRRNLSEPQHMMLAYKKKEIIAAKAKERQSAAGGDKKSEEAKSLNPNLDEAIPAPPPSIPVPNIRPSGYTYTGNVEYKLEHYNPPKPQVKIVDTPKEVNTIKTMAKEANVSHGKMHMFTTIVEKGTPQQLKKVMEQEESVSRVYNAVQAENLTPKKISELEERSRKIEEDKARQQKNEALAKLVENQRPGFAKQLIDATIVQLNRLSADNPDRKKELKRLVDWINAATEAVDEQNIK